MFEERRDVMIDAETWKDLHELYPKNPKILENIVAQLENQIARQQTRINAMQRKIDRCKNYARIKNQKENAAIKPHRIFDRPAKFLPTMTILNVRATFLKTWRV